MADSQEVKIYDIYAPILNFKRSIGDLKRPGIDFTWIPQDHERRLKAYELLEAFYYNYSRDYRFSPDSGDDSQNDTILESGDASWLCRKIKAKLFGDGMILAMEMPDEIKGIKSLESLIANSTDQTAKTKAQTDLQALTGTRDRLTEREKYMLRWWKNNNIFLAIDENETLCSYLGDCAYLVEWVKEIVNGAEIGRPGLRTYDPGFIFPFFGCNDKSLEDNATRVQDRVIIAWQEISKEIADNVGQTQYFVIFRDIYELRIGANGVKKCFRKHGYYKYDASAEIDLNNLVDDNLLNQDNKVWVDLGIDFMPVVLVPNIAVQGHDFGLSNLHFLIGLIDAIINSDTDLKKNSEKLGGASVFVSGKDIALARDSVTKKPVAISIQPNTIYPLGEGGSATLLDTSAMQKAILDTKSVLEKKLIRNSNITEIGAGTIDISLASLSTLSIKILLQPLLDMINPMRNQRNCVYSTMFFYVQRLFQTFGTVEERGIFADPLYDFYLKWGKILPDDDLAQLQEYALLETLTDTETMLEKMKEDGFNIDIKKVMERKKQKADQAAQSQMDIFGLGRQLNNQQGNQGNQGGGK
jgi:hypothetical protein